MWSQSEDSPLGSTAASSLRLSTGVTVEFNTKLTVKLRYLGCRVLTALFRPPTLLHPLSSGWVDNNRAIALGFGDRRFSNGSPGRLPGAHTGCVCGAAWKEAPLGEQRKGGRRFNLADGGTGTLRASLYDTCIPERTLWQTSEPSRVGSLSSKHPSSRLGELGNLLFLNGATGGVGVGGRLFTYHSHLQTFPLDLGGTSVLMNFN